MCTETALYSGTDLANVESDPNLSLLGRYKFNGGKNGQCRRKGKNGPVSDACSGRQMTGKE